MLDILTIRRGFWSHPGPEESATVAEGDDWLAQQQLAVDEFMKNTFRVEVADWDGNKEPDCWGVWVFVGG